MIFLSEHLPREAFGTLPTKVYKGQTGVLPLGCALVNESNIDHTRVDQGGKKSMRRSRRPDLSLGMELAGKLLLASKKTMQSTQLQPRLRVSKKDLAMTVGVPIHMVLRKKSGGLTLLHVVSYHFTSIHFPGNRQHLEV